MDVTSLNKSYPIHLDLTEMHCVIIGGGLIAARRISGLLEAGAKVTVISPHCHLRIDQLSADGSIVNIKRNYEGELDIMNADLVFAATNDETVNRLVAADASKHQIPVNHLGDSTRSTFIVPAVLRRGGLTMSVSTSGASPGLARKIRDELAESYGQEYELYVDFLSELREWVHAKVKNEKSRAIIFHQVLKFDILELSQLDKQRAFRSWLEDMLELDLQTNEWEQKFEECMIDI